MWSWKKLPDLKISQLVVAGKKIVFTTNIAAKKKILGAMSKSYSLVVLDLESNESQVLASAQMMDSSSPLYGSASYRSMSYVDDHIYFNASIKNGDSNAGGSFSMNSKTYKIETIDKSQLPTFSNYSIRSINSVRLFHYPSKSQTPVILHYPEDPYFRNQLPEDYFDSGPHYHHSSKVVKLSGNEFAVVIPKRSNGFGKVNPIVGIWFTTIP